VSFRVVSRCVASRINDAFSRSEHSLTSNNFVAFYQEIQQVFRRPLNINFLDSSNSFIFRCFSVRAAKCGSASIFSQRDFAHIFARGVAVCRALTWLPLGLLGHPLGTLCLHFGILSALCFPTPFGLPFGSPRLPFGAPLAPRGSFSFPFGPLLAPFWSPSAPLGSLLGPFLAPFGAPGVFLVRLGLFFREAQQSINPCIKRTWRIWSCPSVAPLAAIGLEFVDLSCQPCVSGMIFWEPGLCKQGHPSIIKSLEISWRSRQISWPRLGCQASWLDHQDSPFGAPGSLFGAAGSISGL
jgi:hypothetical protein